MLRVGLLAGISLALSVSGSTQPEADFPRLVVPEPEVSLADLRLPANRILPQVESFQHVVFSGSVSGIPRFDGLERITAPPYTVLLRQSFAVVDRATGALYYAGAASGGATVQSPDELVWEPGKARVVTETSVARIEVDQIALRRPQGFILRVKVTNAAPRKRSLLLASVQQPALRRPRAWTYDMQWPRAEESALAVADSDVAVHESADGAVAVGFAGASAVAGASAKEALQAAVAGKSGNRAAATALYRIVDLPAGGSRDFYLVVMVADSAGGALESARRLMRNPQTAAAAARLATQREISTWLKRLPGLVHPDPRVVKFYRHAALQLLYSRWKVGKTFILDPWYPSLGLDSGGLNSYAWDLHYAAVPLTLLDPSGMRSMLVALLSAPLTRHYAIDPVTGEGGGPFYSYSPYAFTAAVDEYIRATGDHTILQEKTKGRTVLEWLVSLAEFGETDRDPDRNHLIDYGDDHNLLEIKTTGSGPGYIHEVPSPNGERVYVYETLASMLEQEDSARHAALIARFRQRATDVSRAVNGVLWMDDVGWYGTRQADGQVAAVYSIQIFDLLRVPGLVPTDRAERIAAHLNDGEFLGPWGIRSLSIKDRLWDWRDHDWAGPISYIGDGPQLVADLYQAGLSRHAWNAWERILWWPEHLAVYPQGIANDDYSTRFPQSRSFGGRVSAGRTNEISGCVGVETVVRGLFGVRPERDGAIGFTAGRQEQDKPMALAYPYRGAVWTVTQRSEGLDVVRNDGFGATLLRDGGTLRFRMGQGKLTIRAKARSGGPGQLRVSGFRCRSASVGGQSIPLRRHHGRLVMELPELGGDGVEVELTGQVEEQRQGRSTAGR